MVEGGAEMTYSVGYVSCGGNGPSLAGYHGPVYEIRNTSNSISPCEGYQRILNSTESTDIIVYIHDDVTIHDPQWLNRVLRAFSQDGIEKHMSDVIAVGLGGALSLGNKDLYRKPYDIRNMARGHYASNQDDWQIHGGHFTGVRRVATIEQFFMAVRTDWLRSRGGWPTKHLTHHMLDAWLACEAARDNKEIWMTGVSCTHHGGGSSTKPIYKDAKWLQAGSMESDHILPHLWIYNEYRNVLPIEV
jgi:hypothetical protein